jgi:two-component system response regulator AtoC
MSDDTDETGQMGPRPLALEVTLPDRTFTVALPADGEVILGRSRSAGIQLDHASVSREHARLRLGAAITLEDLGSRNGTVARGRVLAAHEACALGIGDAFEIGSVPVRLVPVMSRRAAVPPGYDRRAAASGRAALDAPEGWYAPTSPAMQGVLASLEQVAASDMSVLLIGETGVGKEVCAELLHRRSPRAARTLLRLNCSALPEALIESELFGHEKGAFTGAAVARPGLIESADGGTVFLDEIAELPPPAQVKLLRVLDRREVMPVGGRSERIVDVRFVAATHKNLEAEIAAGRFRQDLYYRLAGMTIRIPPLRDRKDEIEPLARRFLDAAARRQGRPPVALSAEALLALQRHPWPGNIRELRNAIERALVVCGAGPIEVPHLPLEREPTGDSGPHTGPIPKIGSLGDELEEIERQRIEAVLVATGGNQSEAARRLGMSRGALLARLRAWGLTGKRPPRP